MTRPDPSARPGTPVTHSARSRPARQSRCRARSSTFAPISNGTSASAAVRGDKMATVYVDNKPYPMNPDENLLHGCLSHGFKLPYFCWHPALGSVGACRQCAVKQFKDEKDTQGKLVMEIGRASCRE